MLDQRFKYLYEVVKQGSIRAAADKLRVVPSAVSRQIGLIEEELGVKVLERNPRGVTPTEIGRLVMQYMRDRRRKLDLLVAAIHDYQGLKVAHIPLAIGEGFISDLVSGPFHEFLTEHPFFTFDIATGSTTDMIELLKLGDVDFAIAVNPTNDPELHTRAESPAPIKAIVSPKHDLTTSPPRSLQDLNKYRLGLLPYENGVTQIVRRAEVRSGMTLKPSLVTASIELLRLFAIRESGVILLPEFAIRRELEAGDLVAVSMDDRELDDAGAYILVRGDRVIQPASELLISHLIDQMLAFKTIRFSD